MISWEDFLTETITTFRKYFQRLSSREQEYIMKKGYYDLPFEPCQIEVLHFGEEKGVAFVLVHDESLPDKTFKIKRDVNSLGESEFVKQYHMRSFSEFKAINRALKKPATLIATKGGLTFFGGRTMRANEIARHFLSQAKSIARVLELEAIVNSTKGLKRSIAKIPEKGLREELLANAKMIDQSLREVKRLDKELTKIRQLVGVTKEIQDWRLLISDVDRLKGEHVPREVFDAKIERLDEKIDKGLEAINARIEDLKAIKFWSKRTLLEIALAILATIATLFATGILRF